MGIIASHLDITSGAAETSSKKFRLMDRLSISHCGLKPGMN